MNQNQTLTSSNKCTENKIVERRNQFNISLRKKRSEELFRTKRIKIMIKNDPSIFEQYSETIFCNRNLLMEAIKENVIQFLKEFDVLLNYMRGLKIFDQNSLNIFFSNKEAKNTLSIVTNHALNLRNFFSYEDNLDKKLTDELYKMYNNNSELPEFNFASRALDFLSKVQFLMVDKSIQNFNNLNLLQNLIENLIWVMCNASAEYILTDPEQPKPYYPVIYKFLESNNSDIIELCLTALNNLIPEKENQCIESSREFLKHNDFIGRIDFIMNNDQLRCSGNYEPILMNLIKFVKNFVISNPYKSVQFYYKYIEFFLSFLKFRERDYSYFAYAGIEFIMRYFTKTNTQELFNQPNFADKLIELCDCRDDLPVAKYCMKILSHIIAEINDTELSKLLEQKLLEKINNNICITIESLENQENIWNAEEMKEYNLKWSYELKEAAIFCYSNVVCADDLQLQHLKILDNSVINNVIQEWGKMQVSRNHFEVAHEASRVFANIFECAKDDWIINFLQSWPEFADFIISTFTQKAEANYLLRNIHILDKILEYGKTIGNQNGLEDNVFVDCLLRLSNERSLDKIQSHKHDTVYQKSVELMEKYCEVDEQLIDLD